MTTRVWRNELAIGWAWAFALSAAAAPAADPGPTWAYRVQPGDTLIGVAQRHLVRPADWPALQRLNQVRAPRRMAIGRELQIPLAWMPQVATVAEVVFVHGQVALKGEGGGGQPPDRALAMGDRLKASDVIRTAADSSATLRFADGSRLLVAAGSEIRIEQLLSVGRPALPAVRLNLQRGSTEAQVAPAPPGRRFEVNTPALNLGVRGTDFRTRVDAEGAQTRLEVLSGRVQTQAGDARVTVEAGMGSVAQSGQAPGSPQALTAAPVLQALPGRLDRLPVQFSWQATAGAQAYRAQVLQGPQKDQLMLDGRFAQPLAKWADLPDGSYTLRVRGVDAQGLEGRDAEQPFTLKARPEPPLVSLPAQGAKVYGDTTQFAWARVAAATRYHLQVSAHADFGDTAYDNAQLLAPLADLPLPPGAYFWRVASIATTADGQADPGPFGDAQAFTQRAEPAAPAMQSPQRGAQGLELRWQQPAAGQRVRFQVARDAAFQQIVQDQTTEQATVLIGEPVPGLYYVRARTIDADGFEGRFGAAQQVEVPPDRPWWLLLPLGLLLLAL